MTQPIPMGLTHKELLEIFDRVITYKSIQAPTGLLSNGDVDRLFSVVCERLKDMANDDRIFVESIKSEGE